MAGTGVVDAQRGTCGVEGVCLLQCGRPEGPAGSLELGGGVLGKDIQSEGGGVDISEGTTEVGGAEEDVSIVAGEGEAVDGVDAVKAGDDGVSGDGAAALIDGPGVHEAFLFGFWVALDGG